MSKTSIEWTDESWNAITGCTRASSGCDNCYSAKMTKRLEAMGQAKYSGLVGNGHFNGVVKCHEDELKVPLKWRKPRRVFVNSMSDTFHKDVPFEFIDKIFAVMALCPHVTFQVLTKRPERAEEYLNTDNRGGLFAYAAQKMQWDGVHSKTRFPIAWPLPNVWLGCSVENQATADERIQHLLKCPAAVRFLSCEPLLGAVDLEAADALGVGAETCHWGDDHSNGKCDCLPRIDWCIAGGESGSGARHCDIEWIRSIVAQCQEANVPCFVKQLGKNVKVSPLEIWRPRDKKGGDISEWPVDLRVRQFPESAPSERGER